MKIKRIFAPRAGLPLAETSSNWSGGKSVPVFDRTVLEVETVAVETACGLTGLGAACPLGPYPLILAGGSKLGLNHGRYLQYSEDVPLSNLFVTMLERMQLPVTSFQDSTGGLPELVS